MRSIAATLRRVLTTVGFEVSRIGASELNTMGAALGRRAKAGSRVSTIVDVGASDGSWTRMAKTYFPDAVCLLLEANRVHQGHLDAYGSESHVQVVYAAAGDVDGPAFFDFSDPLGGLAARQPRPGYGDSPMVRIDSLVDRFNLRPPFLLKLDTHGFEIPILRGAEQTLRQASLLVVETYNFCVAPDAVRFHELCVWLEHVGFRPIDLADPLRRPADGALWQFDLLFAPISNSAFSRDTFDDA